MANVHRDNVHREHASIAFDEKLQFFELHAYTCTPQAPASKRRTGKAKALYAFIRIFKLLTRPHTFSSDLNCEIAIAPFASLAPFASSHLPHHPWKIDPKIFNFLHVTFSYIWVCLTIPFTPMYGLEAFGVTTINRNRDYENRRLIALNHDDEKADQSLNDYIKRV